MVELLLLDSASHLVQSEVSEFDDVEVVNDLGGFGQDGVEDGLVSRRHVKGSEVDPVLPLGGLSIQEACYVNVVATGDQVDYLVVFHITHGGDITGAAAFQSPEAGLV